MSWMSLSDRLLLFIGVMVCVAGFYRPAYAQQSVLDELTEKFKQGQIFHSDFSHHYIDSYTQDTTSSDGMIWVGNDRYKVRTQNQYVVVNGETSMVYDENRNRVIISNYEPAEDDFAPSRILSGIDSTFVVDHQEKNSDNIYILLTSDDPFAIYKEVEIILTPELIPQRIKALDPSDNVIITHFRNGRFVETEQGMFSLDYPDGAEVVDMRN